MKNLIMFAFLLCLSNCGTQVIVEPPLPQTIDFLTLNLAIPLKEGVASEKKLLFCAPELRPFELMIATVTAEADTGIVSFRASITGEASPEDKKTVTCRNGQLTFSSLLSFVGVRAGHTPVVVNVRFPVWGTTGTDTLYATVATK